MVTRSAGLLVKRIESSDGTPAALRETIAPYQYVIDSPIGVFKADGAPIVVVGDGTISPLTKEEYARMTAAEGFYYRRFSELSSPLRLPSGPSYLIVTWRHAEKMRWRFICVIILAFVVIGIMSIPVARSIARPIRAITQTAAALRDGDLSARAKVESNDELSILARTLNDMAEGLDRRIKREKELLANVSHELRTPLARIRVALEIVAETTEPPSVIRQHLEEIATDVQELDQLVGDVLFSTRLDFSNGNSPGFPLNLETVSLVPFLADIASRFETENGHHVQTKLPKSASQARIDKALFRRAIVNLLGNSLKYSRKGGETLITLTQEEDRAVIKVKDRGIGVAKENLAHLFDPFFRTEKSRNRNAGGMGLGLTLAKRIVEAHDGRIFAKQRDGGGLTVVVFLPLLSETARR
jgi:signal transduction histidine kinase